MQPGNCFGFIALCFHVKAVIFHQNVDNGFLMCFCGALRSCTQASCGSRVMVSQPSLSDGPVDWKRAITSLRSCYSVFTD